MLSGQKRDEVLQRSVEFSEALTKTAKMSQQQLDNAEAAAIGALLLGAPGATVGAYMSGRKKKYHKGASPALRAFGGSALGGLSGGLLGLPLGPLGVLLGAKTGGMYGAYKGAGSAKLKKLKKAKKVKKASVSLQALRHASHTLASTHLEKTAVVGQLFAGATAKPLATGVLGSLGFGLKEVASLEKIRKAVAAAKGTGDEAVKAQKFLAGIRAEATKANPTKAAQGRLDFLKKMETMGSPGSKAGIVDYVKAYAPSVSREAGLGGVLTGGLAQAGKMYGAHARKQAINRAVSTYAPAAALGAGGLGVAAAM